MALNERLEKKLKKILAKAGVKEDKIDEVVEEVEAATSEEEVPEEEPIPEETPLPPSEEEVVEPTPEEVVEEAAPGEGEPIPEQVAPSDGNIEAALQELAAQEEGAPTPEEIPPQEPTPDQLPPVPQVDPQVQELVAQLGEANKTIEGLVARIDSLEAALKESGIISGTSPLGDENPRITPNANANNEDAFDDIIATINGK